MLKKSAYSNNLAFGLGYLFLGAFGLTIREPSHILHKSRATKGDKMERIREDLSDPKWFDGGFIEIDGKVYGIKTPALWDIEEDEWVEIYNPEIYKII